MNTALDLFEQGIRPIVLTRYCGSSGGSAVERAALLCLEMSLGKRQVVGDSLVPEEARNLNHGLPEETLIPAKIGMLLVEIMGLVLLCMMFCSWLVLLVRRYCLV